MYARMIETDSDPYNGSQVRLFLSLSELDFQIDVLKSFKDATSSLRPQKALCGGIPCPFLEPLARSWSHFVGIYRQKLTRSFEN